MESHDRERESLAHPASSSSPHTDRIRRDNEALASWIAHSFPAMMSMRAALKEDEDRLREEWLSTKARFDALRPKTPLEGNVPSMFYVLARADWTLETLQDGRVRIIADAATWAQAAASLTANNVKHYRKEALRRANVLEQHERTVAELDQACGCDAKWWQFNEAAAERGNCEDAIILKIPKTFADVAQQVAVLRNWGHGGNDDGMIGAFFETLERAAQGAPRADISPARPPANLSNNN